MELPNRKSTRLKDYDYSTPGAYFVTICTKGRREILSEIIVGADVLDGPQNILYQYGEIANKHLLAMHNFYDNISIVKYVIMPNHIHLLIQITDGNNGPPRTSVPTKSLLSNFISTFKRFCNKEYGENVWQRSFHDHIIRNEQDYVKIAEYIDTNPLTWELDCFYNSNENEKSSQ